MSIANRNIGFFEKHLTLWVLLCMAVGILIGKFLPDIPALLQQFEYAHTSIPIAVLIWIMIYPMTLIIIFSFQGDAILNNPLHVLMIAVPLVLQNIITALFAYLLCKKMKQPHNIAAPAALIGASDFFELSVAVAITLFGATSPVVLVTTVGVLTEVPVMLMLVRFVNKTRHWFPGPISE